MAPCYAEEEEVGQSCWMVVTKSRSVCSLVLQQPSSRLRQAVIEAAAVKVLTGETLADLAQLLTLSRSHGR